MTLLSLKQPLDSSGEIIFNFNARTGESAFTTLKENENNAVDKPVLPVNSGPALHTVEETVEHEAVATIDPYDLYYKVLDEAEEDPADEIIFDDGWIFSNVEESTMNEDPNTNS